MLLEKIKVDYNPRTQFEGIVELANNIKELGLLTPLTVQKNTGILLDGGRRYQALKKLGIKEVAVIEVDLEEHQQKEVAVATDFFKDKLNVVERAIGVSNMINKEKKYTAQTIAKRYGWTVKEVNKMLKIATLHSGVLAHIQNSKLTVEEGLELSIIKREDKQIEIADIMVEHSKELEDIIYEGEILFVLEFNDVFTYEQAKKDNQIAFVYTNEYDDEDIVVCYDKSYYEEKQAEYEERTKKEYEKIEKKQEKRKDAQEEKVEDKEQAKKDRKKAKGKFTETLPLFKEGIIKYLKSKPDDKLYAKIVDTYTYKISGDNCRLILRAFDVEFKSSEIDSSGLKKLVYQTLEGLVKTPEQAVRLVDLCENILPENWKVSMFSSDDVARWKKVITKLNKV